MNSEYLATINRFSGLNVLVIGDAMLDVYLDGSANRICREAPVPIVDIKDVFIMFLLRPDSKLLACHPTVQAP